MLVILVNAKTSDVEPESGSQNTALQMDTESKTGAAFQCSE